jgi:hypothetical protein
MKLLFLLVCSLSAEVFAASCCVSNTSISNLMILPSAWQETFTISQARVIGDANSDGQSTFRKAFNKEITNLARLDLAYSWSLRYQTGISVKYQSRLREFNGSSSSNSGWNDLGLSHAWRLGALERVWIFQTLNIPTAPSVYDSKSNLTVDARGTGTYISSMGIFGIYNLKEWDFLYSSEIHHSFKRNFRRESEDTSVGAFWGGSITVGAGFIPFRSKARYGMALSPRLEGEKEVIVNGMASSSRSSLVWDTSVNFTYTINAEHALGLNYTDQTIWGPVRNTLLNRSLSLQYQTRWL